MLPPDSPWPPEFVLGRPVAIEEDGLHEFKTVTGQNPARTIADTVEEYAVAFLNAEGGRILWGIRDKDRSVVGVALNAAARDRIRRDIASKLHNIQPAVSPSRWELNFHPVSGAPDTDLAIVEVAIEESEAGRTYFTHRHEVVVRVNGLNQRLQGPRLEAWILARAQAGHQSTTAIRDPKLKALVERVRRVFAEHGLEPTHISRFLEKRRAPFSIQLTDLETDNSLLAWITEEKLRWLSATFLIRRAWIDGEDERVHEEFCFDKRPQVFWTTASEHADALIWDNVPESPSIYFLRWGIDQEWERKGQGRVFVVLAIPLGRLSNERTIYSYITDCQPYPWTRYARTYIQLRAWARLLTVHKHFLCFGREIAYEVGEKLWSNRIFLREVIDRQCQPTRDDWNPDDYARYPEESVIAKGLDTLPQVIEFLRSHNLPWENTHSLKN